MMQTLGGKGEAHRFEVVVKLEQVVRHNLQQRRHRNALGDADAGRRRVRNRRGRHVNSSNTYTKAHPTAQPHPPNTAAAESKANQQRSRRERTWLAGRDHGANTWRAPRRRRRASDPAAPEPLRRRRGEGGGIDGDAAAVARRDRCEDDAREDGAAMASWPLALLACLLASAPAPPCVLFWDLVSATRRATRGEGWWVGVGVGGGALACARGDGSFFVWRRVHLPYRRAREIGIGGQASCCGFAHVGAAYHSVAHLDSCFAGGGNM